MRYVGGKSKLAKELVEIFKGHQQSRTHYLEPFVGGGAMLTEAVNALSLSSFTASDTHLDLVMMYQAMVTGWMPYVPSEQQYQDIKQGPCCAQRGFTGFGCSFGGKWFGGYARGGFNKAGARNHQAESYASLMQARDAIRRARFLFCDYREWKPDSSCIVYCDPPYANTQTYAVGAFDHAVFWQTMREWRKAGAAVFISEYEAPSDFQCIWTKQHRQSLQHGLDGREIVTERLFA